MRGETVLVTAGPTREDLDPVRFLSNHSSGKMGYALAIAARRRGARVLLVSGPTALEVPLGVEFCPVSSGRQMREAVLERAAEATIIIKAAAVADFRPAQLSREKIKKRAEGAMSIALVKNPDILAELGQQKREGQVLVGFAAETGDLLEQASRKLEEKNLDLIVANDVTQAGAGFDVETNIVRLLYGDGSVEDLPQMSKLEVAGRILDRIGRLAERLRQGPGEAQ
jgi:phosphopantothenoylcysteine decarboxylase/phosphopantothenate--cysteine ligase